MNSVYQPITISQIPNDILFEGYYWNADDKSPTVISPPALIQHSWFTELPFIIEANFYARTEQISIQVRHWDGVYHVAKIDLSRLDGITHDRVSYIGHDLGGLDFEMIEAWEAKTDELLEGMETLVPTWAAFAGFTNTKEK
jgi:CRISPR type III-associated protein (TIGR04423 family)